jgi:hypothetical protein
MTVEPGFGGAVVHPVDDAGSWPCARLLRHPGSTSGFRLTVTEGARSIAAEEPAPILSSRGIESLFSNAGAGRAGRSPPVALRRRSHWRPAGSPTLLELGHDWSSAKTKLRSGFCEVTRQPVSCPIDIRGQHGGDEAKTGDKVGGAPLASILPRSGVRSPPGPIGQVCRLPAPLPHCGLAGRHIPP